jgi:hypothetical protein
MFAEVTASRRPHANVIASRLNVFMTGPFQTGCTLSKHRQESLILRWSLQLGEGGLHVGPFFIYNGAVAPQLPAGENLAAEAVEISPPSPP